MQTVMAYVPVKRALNASIGRAPATDLTVNFVKYFINHLTATQKNNPYANCFLVKIKLFLNYIRPRQNIPDARYQYSLGIYRRIYPAVGG